MPETAEEAARRRAREEATVERARREAAEAAAAERARRDAADAAAADSIAEDEARLRAKSRRIMESAAKRMERRILEMKAEWNDVQAKMTAYKANPTGPEAATQMGKIRNGMAMAKERRQELTSDRRIWTEALYDAGMSPAEEKDKLDTLRSMCDRANEAHEKNLDGANAFMREVEDAEKLRREPTDSRLFKLPPLAIKEFKGDPEKFVSFQQHFEAVVGKQKLQDHQKLVHLKGCLKGKAAEAIISVGTEDADYQRAWAILRERFGDKAEVVSQLIGRLSAMVLPPNSSPETQRKFCDEVSARYNRLREVDPGIGAQDSTLRAMVLNCFSPEIKSQIVREMGKTPSIVDFLRRAQELIGIEVHVHGKNPFKGEKPQDPGRNRGFRGGRGNGGNGGGTTAALAATTRGQLKRGGPAGSQRGGLAPRGPPRNQGAGNGTDRPQGPNKCSMCQGVGHGLATCEEFKKIPPRLRMEKVRQLRCCFRCLRRGHFGKECTFARKCSAVVDGKECGRTSHHVLLHRNPQVNK